MPIEPRLQLPWLRVHKVNNKRVVVHELTRGRMREEFVDTSISLKTIPMHCLLFSLGLLRYIGSCNHDD